MLFLDSISYLGVLISAVVGMLIGFLWYSNFLFAQKWMQLSKISPKQMENANMPLSAGMGFVITLILSFCLANVYHYFGSLEPALKGLIFIIFFVAVEFAGNLIWEKMPLPLYCINMGHKAVSWIAMLLVYAAVFNALT